MDYIEKPFAIGELRVRLGGALARLRKDGLVLLGDLVLDREAGCVRRGIEPLPLSRREFDLLLYLVYHRSRPVSWKELVSAVWQCDLACGTPEMVRNAVSRLRRKLGDTGPEPRYIQTLHGVGYQVVGQTNKTDTKVIRF